MPDKTRTQGRRGPRGPAGRRGPRGPQGRKGTNGALGPKEQPGATGPLHSGERMELLTVVESQLQDVFRELDMQMKRMAQIQMQIDELRARLRQVIGG